MKLLQFAASASLLLCVACPRVNVLPDARIPHQIAKDAEVWVWCHDPVETVRWVKCRVRAGEGWWLASPLVVDGGK